MLQGLKSNDFLKRNSLVKISQQEAKNFKQANNNGKGYMCAYVRITSIPQVTQGTNNFYARSVSNFQETSILYRLNFAKILKNMKQYISKFT